MQSLKTISYLSLLVLLISCNTYSESIVKSIDGNAGSRLFAESYAEFNEPWAMTFLPDGKLLITEKKGNLIIFDTEKRSRTLVKGVPKVAYGGQGGLGDIILHPEYENNSLVYLSYAEAGSFGKKGAVVVRAKLSIKANIASLINIEKIWKQYPKVTGSGHYSHRMAFDSEGYLFISSGERQKQKPAQNRSGNLGKIIRLYADGSIPNDNPFQDKGEIAKSFWSTGHRNILGMAFDQNGNLWAQEMGPKHGDELNLIIKGDNYGWPIVSWGDQYSGIKIPDHDTRPEFHSPEVYWVPTIAPSGLVIYKGDMFMDWRGDALIGGLRSRSIVRVAIDGKRAYEKERFDMGKRIREVEEGLDGAIWLLEDQSGGRLLKLMLSE